MIGFEIFGCLSSARTHVQLDLFRHVCELRQRQRTRVRILVRFCRKFHDGASTDEWHSSVKDATVPDVQ